MPAMRRFLLVLSLAVVGAVSVSAQRLDPVWPTPNTAYVEGRGVAEFVQPTVSGEVESGLFGCVRSGGAQYHEGLDLKPIARDRRGEPTDPIFAVLPGVVRHISRSSGDSAYGRYIVIEHGDQSLPVITLYAHLASVAPGIVEGGRVERGQTIATMGRSAGGYTIPRERAHLHFEIALWMTRNFQSWYVGRQFGSANTHGIWNGMNIMGVDALDFYNQLRARRVDSFEAYFESQPVVTKVRIASSRVPDFIQRYPNFLTKDLPLGGVGGWEISFNRTGLPIAWTPLVGMELIGYRRDEVRIIETDDAALKRFRCKQLVTTRAGKRVPGKDLQTALQLLFGLK